MTQTDQKLEIHKVFGGASRIGLAPIFLYWNIQYSFSVETLGDLPLPKLVALVLPWISSYPWETSQISNYLACVAPVLLWPRTCSPCPSNLSVLDEFPDDVPAVISLYDLLEALAAWNSIHQPHLVLSNDIPPHLRGPAPLYASPRYLAKQHNPGTSTSNP
jgi:hypothetical protein